MALTDTAKMRQSLVLRVRDCSQRLLPLLHSSTSVSMDETLNSAADLLSTIEQCLFYGLISEGPSEPGSTRDDGDNHLFAFIQLLDSYSQPFIPALRASALRIALNPLLYTTMGQARGWIREVLNKSVLDQVLEATMAHPKMIKTFWRFDSVMATPLEFGMLVAVARSLRVFPFRFTVGDRRCNETPRWLANHSLVLPMSPRQSTSSGNGYYNSNSSLQVASPSNPNTSSGSDGSREVSRGLLSGVGSLFESASSMAIKFIESSPIDNSSGRGSSNSSSSNSNGSRTRIPFFATPLQDLVLDDFRCMHSSLDPHLGVPTQVLRLIAIIELHAATPALFRQQPRASDFETMKRALEEEADILVSSGPTPDSSSSSSGPALVHTAAALLCEWLHLLPEPLLGLQLHVALRETQNLDHDEEVRARNLRLLIEQSPWYAQPTLVKLISMLATLLEPSNAEKNELSVISLGIVFAPFLSRKMALLPRAGSRNFHSIMMRTVASGITVVQFILRRHEEIFREKRVQLDRRRQQLEAKASAVAEVQSKVLACVTCQKMSLSLLSLPVSQYLERLDAVQALWLALGPVHRLRFISRKIPASILASFDVLPEREEMAKSSRWKYCGFPLSPLGTIATEMTLNVQEYPPSSEVPTAFPSNLQSLSTFALTTLERFLTKHSPKSHRVVLAFVLDRDKFGDSLAGTVNALILQSAFALELICESDTGENKNNNISTRGCGRFASASASASACANAVALPFSVVSKAPSWELMSGQREQIESVFQHFFDMALLTYDDSYLSLTSRVRRLPSTDTGALALQEATQMIRAVLDKRPQNVQALWQLWADLRVRKMVSRFSRTGAGGAATEWTSDGEESSSDEESSEASDNDDDGAEIEVAIDEDGIDRQNVVKDLMRDPYKSPKVSTKRSVLDLQTRVIGKSRILNRREVYELEKSCPPQFQVRDWKLLYATDLHGSSLSSLITNCQAAKASLMIVRTTAGQVFGGLIPCQLRAKDSETFYGNSSAMVFSLVHGILDVFASSGKNELYVFCHRVKGFGLGSGGAFAFWLDQDLNHGTAGCSETFQNDMLVSEEADFQIEFVEVYGIM